MFEERRRGTSGENSPVETADVVSFLAVVESLIDPLSAWKFGRRRGGGGLAIESRLKVATSGVVRPLTIVALPFCRWPAVGVDGLRVLRALVKCCSHHTHTVRLTDTVITSATRSCTSTSASLLHISPRLNATAISSPLNKRRMNSTGGRAVWTSSPPTYPWYKCTKRMTFETRQPTML